MNNSDKFSANRFEKHLIVGFSLLLLLIYLFFPTREFYWDGIIYAQFIEDSESFGAHLLHPNHLFYNFLGYIAFHTAQSIGLQTRAIYVLQFVTTIFAVLCAIAFYAIAKNVFRSIYPSITLTGLLAFSAAWWRFSTDADVYIISIFFLLAAFYFALPDKAPRPFLTAVFHSLAMFFHQLAVLAFPAIVVALIFQTVPLEKRKRILIVLRYSLAAFLLTFGTYCLSFYFLTGSFDVRSFAHWIFSYAPVAGFSPNLQESLHLTVRGHQKLFFDGSSRLFGRSLINIILLAMFAVSAVLFLYKLIRFFGEIKIRWKSVFERKFYNQPIVFICLAWIMPYLVFLFFFLPENIFYRLFYFPALVILIGAFFASDENPNRGRRALFVLIFALYNFLFYIEPNARIRENTPLALAIRANAVWTEKTIVFYVRSEHFDSLETKDRLVKYFNPAVAWKPLDSIKLKEFEEEIRKLQSDGKDVWLATSAIEKMTAEPQTAEWLMNKTKQPAELDIPQTNMKFVRLIP